MLVAKQMFEIFIDKTLALNYPHHIGLVKFAMDATVDLPITHVIEDFRDAVKEVQPQGGTALWKALSIANNELKSYGRRHPNAKKRIIVLTDGEDSTWNPDHRKVINWDIVSAHE